MAKWKFILAFAAMSMISLMLTACAAPQEAELPQVGADVWGEATENETQIIKEEGSSNEGNLESEYTVTAGSEMYRGFVIDNVLHSERTGDIHYHVYVPEDYDGSRPYSLFVTLPGYEALYFQGVAENLKAEEYAFEVQKYRKEMIVAAPQLEDWGETSAEQTIELIDYFLANYNIDPQNVYANGYSGGGETMSLVLEERPGLFAAYLHCSSRWDGDYEAVVEQKLPIYFAVGENDEYYGSRPTQEAYRTLYEQYQAEGLSEDEIDQILVLDIKPESYFQNRGISSQHAGGLEFAHDESIMGWLFQN